MFVRNPGRGAHAAVMAGFAASTAPIVVVYPADDDFNAGIIDRMVALAARGMRRRLRQPLHARRHHAGLPLAQGRPGADRSVHAASSSHGCRPRDPTSGFRMFSRRVIERIEVESDQGFCYSIELLVKAHRLGWRIGEVPALWFERQHGSSRFRVLKWLPAYLRWYRYAFATTYLAPRPGHGRIAGPSEHDGAVRMTEQWPKIKSRQTITLSPWVDIIAREVEFAPGEPTQIYHAVGQQDYLAIVALTPDGRFPMVRQYRPALEAFTWELPAGLAEPGEDPAEGCQRELLEETGYPARAIHALGTAAPCTGRLSNRHPFLFSAKPTSASRLHAGARSCR